CASPPATKGADAALQSSGDLFGKLKLTIYNNLRSAGRISRRPLAPIGSTISAYFFNRRLFFRRTINKPAWIERASNSILERCTLVNVCEVGARLTIGDVYDLPRGSEP